MRESLAPVVENIWLAQFPQRLLGIDVGRNVTVIRLNDGRLVIHSSAPFTAEDILAIRQLGEPAWLLDATLFHDSFAKQGCAAFARVPYLAPRGFRQIAEVSTLPLDPPPNDWAGEVEVIKLEGAPKVNEHVFFHRRSRTLVVADLLFHFPADAHGWTRFVARHVMRLPKLVGMSAFLKMMVSDKAAFTRSIERVLACDFERIVVGHGDVITQRAKDVLRSAMRDRGFDVR